MAMEASYLNGSDLGVLACQRPESVSYAYDIDISGTQDFPNCRNSSYQQKK